MKKTDYFSFSRINKFKKCNFAYFLSYIQNIKIDLEFPFFKFGRMVHYGLEIGEYDKSFEKFYKEELDEELYERGKTAFNIGMSFLESIKEHIEKDLYDEIDKEDTELDLFYEYNDIIGIRGKIDHFIQTKNGKIYIIDWKTGRPKDSYKQKYFFQMEIYALLISKNITNFKEITSILVFLEEKTNVNKISLEKTYIEEDLNEIENKLFKELQEISNQKIFKPNSYEFNCKFCDYKEVCPYSPYANPELEEYKIIKEILDK